MEAYSYSLLVIYQRVKPWGILVSTYYGFMRNIVTETFKIVLLKRETFSLILVSEKAFSQLKLLIARLVRSKFASIKDQTSLKYGGGQ